jgi:hypothetical protein
MNIDIEVTFKIRVSDQMPQDQPKPALLAVLLNRIVSHPCVVMILREMLRGS